MNKVIKKTLSVLMICAIFIAFMPILNGSYASAASSKKPGKIASLKVKAKSTSAKISWSKSKGAKKYQVKITLGKKTVNSKTVKKTSITIKKLKKKKTYTVYVRGINGKKKGKWKKKKFKTGKTAAPTNSTVPSTPAYVAPPADSESSESSTDPDYIPAATEYYKNNAELKATIYAEDSEDVLTEEEVEPFLEGKGFGEYQTTYDYSIYGESNDDTVIDDSSDELHPMYQTYYISKNGEAWAIYVINGAVFANPISFNLNSDLNAQLLISESKTLTSYDEETNQFYVTIPHATEAIVHTVDAINADTLDRLTIEELCSLTGASISSFTEKENAQNDEPDESSHSLSSYDINDEETSGGNPGYSRENPLVVVSLGDSYSSGEGIEPFYSQEEALDRKIAIDDWLAHRSQKSWPSLLRVPNVEGTMANYKVPLDSTNDAICQWYFAASSGAETWHFWDGQKKEYDISTGLFSERVKEHKYLAPQLDVFEDLWGEVDYVTLSIGGNDVGFADIIMTCAVNSTYLHFGAESKLEEKLDATWNDIEYTESSIYDAYQGIHRGAGNQASIIVAGYPQLLSPDGKGFVISQKEAKLVNKNVSLFNNRIKRIIKDCQDDGIDIRFVDVESEFSGHLAYSNAPWINEIIFTKESQDLDNHWFGSAYSMHPNALGAQAYARLVNATIRAIEEEKENQLRIVLTWGDEPDDLDSHLVGPDKYGDRFHVYYANKNSNGVSLDVDETDGRGRETIMVRKINSGVYTYAVHNYSDQNDSDSNTMALSGAQVKVYRGTSLLGSFSVPNAGGTLWTVFSYNSSTQEITPINGMSYESVSEEVLYGNNTRGVTAQSNNNEPESVKNQIFSDIDKNDKDKQ